MNKVLSLLGLAKKAGRLEIGEEPTGAAARARDARLLLIASDAADNSFRRLRHFAEAGACLYTRLPCTKDMLGKAVGRTSCAMVAVTDIGFANALMKALSEKEPERYAALAGEMSGRFEKAQRRKKEAAAHERNKRIGKRRTNV